MSEEIRTTSSTGGQKGVKPQRHSLLPKQGLDAIAEVYAFGASKYAAHNWRRGYEWSKSYDALIRHAQAFWDGETYDEESGLNHLAHAGFHVLSMLTWFAQQGEGADNPFDDRWPAGLERIQRAEGDPKTYGEALERAIEEYRQEVATGIFDPEAWSIQAAAEDVQRYGRDSEWPLQGMTREVYEAREAEMAKRRAQQEHRRRLAMEGLEPEEVQHGWIQRGSVLEEPEPAPEADEDAFVSVGYIEADGIRQVFEEEDLAAPQAWAGLDKLLGRIESAVFADLKDDQAEAAGFKVARKDPEPITFELREVSLETMALMLGVPVEDLMKPPAPEPPTPPAGGYLEAYEAALLGAIPVRFIAGADGIEDLAPGVLVGDFGPDLLRKHRPMR